MPDLPDMVDPLRAPLPPDGGGLCYEDEAHFDETFTRVARDHLAGRAGRYERGMIPAVLVVGGLISLTGCVRLGPGWGVGAMVLALAALVFCMSRETRHAHQIETMRLCFQCGHALLHAPTSEDGWGRCPECGTPFNDGYYRRPDATYRRDV